MKKVINPCRWKGCRKNATALLVGVCLCSEHHAKGVKLEGKKNWPQFLRTLAKCVPGPSARDLVLQAKSYEEPDGMAGEGVPVGGGDPPSDESGAAAGGAA